MKLLCTDLDRTLVPNGEQPESALARPVLWHLLRSHDMILAYVSGRDLDRVLQAIEEHDLQIPDVIVADVGTSIYVSGERGWQLHDGWHDLIGRDWNGYDSPGIGESLGSFTQMEAQEADRQTRYKRSYYLPRDLDASALGQQLESHLQGLGVRASLVFSDDPEKNVQLLDILPVHATKREAIEHVRQMQGLANEACLFSGDSGNDVTALASQLPSVTVKNADQPTREAVRKLAETNGTLDNSYQAEGGLALADGQALNGNYAAGIVEGLVYFNPAWRELLLSTDWLNEAQVHGSPSAVNASRRA
ncbi:HAD-IIB family hydrolase [Granulosicoccus sp. 3-233]|uniref:HAD-IIB family hydrolase n=1 Tax=Granulosicoccus sp. 3-233 TaxID=3417969 RepID=UPI003D3299FD